MKLLFYGKCEWQPGEEPIATLSLSSLERLSVPVLGPRGNLTPPIPSSENKKKFRSDEVGSNRIARFCFPRFR